MSTKDAKTPAAARALRVLRHLRAFVIQTPTPLRARPQRPRNLVDQPLGQGFHIGGAALVVLEVAQAGLGVGRGATQQVAPAGRGRLALGGLEVITARL